MVATSDHNLPTLLLLPPPPRPATRHALRVAYQLPLTAALSRLERDGIAHSGNSLEPHILVIAVACPILTDGPDPGCKSIYWKQAQSLLAGLYSLVAHICTVQSITTDIGEDQPGVVDPRIILVHYDQTQQHNCSSASRSNEFNGTSVLDLAVFASTVHPWQAILLPSGETGYGLLAAYLRFAETRQTITQDKICVVDGGLFFSAPTATPSGEKLRPSSRHDSFNSDIEEPVRGYETVCLGGTFDHLHFGHKLLLYAAALLLDISSGNVNGIPCELIIGISGDGLLTGKQYAEELQPWDTRARSVLAFLSTIFNSPTLYKINITSFGPTFIDHGVECQSELRATFLNGSVVVRCVNISDPFGPTVSEKGIKAIVVSRETRSGGQAINEKRKALGWNTLEIYEIDVLDSRVDGELGGDTGDFDEGSNQPQTGTAHDFSSKISSTAIRKRKAEERNRR